VFVVGLLVVVIWVGGLIDLVEGVGELVLLGDAGILV